MLNMSSYVAWTHTDNPEFYRLYWWCLLCLLYATGTCVIGPTLHLICMNNRIWPSVFYNWRLMRATSCLLFGGWRELSKASKCWPKKLSLLSLTGRVCMRVNRERGRLQVENVPCVSRSQWTYRCWRRALIACAGTAWRIAWGERRVVRWEIL